MTTTIDTIHEGMRMLLAARTAVEANDDKAAIFALSEAEVCIGAANRELQRSPQHIEYLVPNDPADSIDTDCCQ